MGWERSERGVPAPPVFALQMNSVCVHVHIHAPKQFVLGLWDNSLT